MQRTIRSLHDLLQYQAGCRAEAPAILAPNRDPSTYGQVLRCVDTIRAALESLGIERGDRVALALANGPELAAAFLGVATFATAAPLNPAYRADEFQPSTPAVSGEALLPDRCNMFRPSLASPDTVATHPEAGR